MTLVLNLSHLVQVVTQFAVIIQIGTGNSAALVQWALQL